jgi:hypothetical protein
MAFEHVEHHRRLGDIERGDAFLGAQGLALLQGPFRRRCQCPGATSNRKWDQV